MKNLKDSILEKLKVDDIIIEKFPTGENLEDIIKFLKKEGFKEYKIDNSNLVDSFNKIKSKIFLLINEQSNSRLWFADTSKEKISEHNPVFFLFKYNGMKIEWKCFREDYKYIFSDKHKVIDLINKCFGWQ